MSGGGPPPQRPAGAGDPVQACALYDFFPHLDAHALAVRIMSLEPAAPPVEVTPLRMRADSQGATAHGLVSQGDVYVAMQVLARPLPTRALRRTVAIAPIEPEARERLAAHRVHMTCTVLGGSPPATGAGGTVEGFVLLLKLGIGLCEQGALAVVNETAATCLTAETMGGVAATAAMANAAPSIGGAAVVGEHGPDSLWESLRVEGAPAELLVGLMPVDIDGALWLVTAGHGLFGLPELAYAARGLEEYNEVEGGFRALFYHLYEQGPPPEANALDIPLDDSTTATIQSADATPAALAEAAATRVVTFAASGLD